MMMTMTRSRAARRFVYALLHRYLRGPIPAPASSYPGNEPSSSAKCVIVLSSLAEYSLTTTTNALPQNNRGNYAGLSWKQRLQENSKRRELLPVQDFVANGVAKCLDSKVRAEEHQQMAHGSGSGGASSHDRDGSYRWRLQVTKNRLGKVDMKAARAARGSYKVSKTCITRSVFMGLLKMASSSEIMEQQQVLRLPERQPFRDGTVFEVVSFCKLCAILMKSYQMVSSDESGVLQGHTNEIVRFVEKGMALAKAGGSTRKVGESCRSCKPWMCLKKTIKDANVQPMQLVANNSGLDKSLFEGFIIQDESASKKRVDWFVHRYWFMGHSVMQRKSGDPGDDDNDGGSSSSSSSGGEQGSENDEAEEDGEQALHFDYRTFSEWGCEQGCGEGFKDVEGRQVEEGASEKGGKEGVNEWTTLQGKQLASPFDPMVVRVVERAVREVLGGAV